MLQATLPMSVRAAAVADPPADQQQQDAAEQVQQPAVQQPAPGITLAAADSSTTKPTASLQMLFLVMVAALALAGITVSLVFRLGRIRARRAMRTSPACDVGFSQDQAFSAADAFTRRRSAPPTFHREEARMRRAEAAHNPRPHDARERARNGRLPTCWPGSPAARSHNRNCGSGYFSSWRCRLRTNSVRPVRRSRLSRSALRIDCTSANASSTFWLTTM